MRTIVEKVSSDYQLMMITFCQIKWNMHDVDADQLGTETEKFCERCRSSNCSLWITCLLGFLLKIKIPSPFVRPCG